MAWFRWLETRSAWVAVLDWAVRAAVWASLAVFAAFAAIALAEPLGSFPLAALQVVGAVLLLASATVFVHKSVRAALIAVAHRRAELRIGPRDENQSPPANEQRNLLPSQWGFVENITKEVCERDSSVLSAKLYAIEGVWGSGKSTIVSAILSQLKRSFDERRHEGNGRRHLPLYMNAWREETPDDLHFRVVENVVLHPTVLAIAAPLLTTRFLLGLAKGKPLKKVSGWKWARLKGRGNAGISSQNKAALEAEAKWEQPTPLDFQEDLDRIMTAMRRRGIDVVLVVDEIERGTRQSAQAMAVLLKRSFDYPCLHLIVPYVPEVMDSMVFDPLTQTSEELRTATDAVLQSHEVLRDSALRTASGLLKLAVPTLGSPTHGDRLFADELAKRTPTQVSANCAAAAALAQQGFRAALLEGYCGLDKLEFAPLQRRMQEKYFGFSRLIPKPDADDLAVFMISQLRLWSKSEEELEVKVIAALVAVAYEMEVPKARSYFRGLLHDPSINSPIRISLRTALGRLENLRAMSFGPGEFSIRTFDGELRRLFDRWVRLSPGSVGLNVTDDIMRSEGARRSPDEFVAQILAHAVLVAVGLMRARLRTSGARVANE